MGDRASGRTVLVTTVGAATGAKAAAAALACAGSEPDGAGLLIDVGGRRPRPTLVASSGARALEERLVAHLPHLGAASRGQTCHLAVPDDAGAAENVAAALPLVRDSIAALHVPPALLQQLLAISGIEPRAVVLRADLESDRALTALAARELIGRRVRVKVLRQPLAWVPARRALFGVLPPRAPGALPLTLLDSLLESQISAAHACYSEIDDAKADPTRVAQQERRGDESARRGGGLHRDQQWQAGR
jgi:hypothetical protein